MEERETQEKRNESECLKCPDFDNKEHFCNANMFIHDFHPKCLLKMILQELRIMNLNEQEGDEWKI